MSGCLKFRGQSANVLQSSTEHKEDLSTVHL